MRIIKTLLILLVILITLTRCHEDETVKPRVPEEPVADIPLGNGATDEASVDALSIEGTVTGEDGDGYEAEGTLFADIGGEKAAVATGEFTVTTDEEGNLLSLEGKGPAQLPDFGKFKSFISDAAASHFVYNTGKYFKALNDQFSALPLRDSSYYFFFNLIGLAAGEDVDWQVSNASLGVTSYFVNLPQEEIVIPTGSLSFALPSGTVKVGDALAIGISGKGSFPFSPATYEDSAINAIIDEQKAFSDHRGMLYLSGEMSFTKAMPYNISGDVVVDADFEGLFENGLSGECDIAMNGKLLFGHDILDALPVDMETELVNVTMRVRGGGIGGGGGNGGVAFAGEFDDNAFMGTILKELAGKTVADNFPISGNDGSLFMTFDDSPDDFALYVRAEFGMMIPGIGERELRKGIFQITPDEILVSGGFGLPFIPGNLYASGQIGFDGKVHLTGSAVGDLQINDGLKFNATLTVDIYNDSVTLKGNIDVPYEIGKVDIKGSIGSEGLAFRGKVNTHFHHGGFSLPLTNLEINGTHEGVTLKGALLVNENYPVAQVTGSMSKKEFYLSGTLSSPKLPFGNGSNHTNVLSANLHLTASSIKGVQFAGNLTIPFGIAQVDVRGGILPNSDAHGFPEIFLNAEIRSNAVMQFGGLSFLSAGMHMNLSTIHGVTFRGKLHIHGGFGQATVNGRIQGSHVSFEGNFGSHVGLGGKSMKAEMTVAVSSAGDVKVAGFGKGEFPVVVRGLVHTPIGIDLNAVGVIDWNGKPVTYGNLVSNHDFGLVELNGTLQFEFGQTIGIYFHGGICVDVGFHKECANDTFALTVDWDGITNEKLCFIKCVSIMDVYNALK